MTIDTKELRLPVQDCKLAGSPVFVRVADMNEILDRLEEVEKERDALSAKISDLTINVEYLGNLKKSYEELIGKLQEERVKIAEVEKQEPPRGWWDDLITDISAIDCMYRGSPTYAHDAYWMRDRVVWMLKQRRDSTPGVNGEAK